MSHHCFCWKEEVLAIFVICYLDICLLVCHALNTASVVFLQFNVDRFFLNNVCVYGIFFKRRKNPRLTLIVVSWYVLRFKPQSFHNLNQVLWVSKHNHKIFNHVAFMKNKWNILHNADLFWIMFCYLWQICHKNVISCW